VVTQQKNRILLQLISVLTRMNSTTADQHGMQEVSSVHAAGSEDGTAADTQKGRTYAYRGCLYI
jgi:hypothetical protein